MFDYSKYTREELEEFCHRLIVAVRRAGNLGRYYQREIEKLHATSDLQQLLIETQKEHIDEARQEFIALQRQLLDAQKILAELKSLAEI